jgi:hypothetical protein
MRLQSRKPPPVRSASAESAVSVGRRWSCGEIGLFSADAGGNRDLLIDQVFLADLLKLL